MMWGCAGGLILLSGCPPPVDRSPGSALRRRIERIADFLDSAAHAGVSWEAHVVLCYRLAQDRDPTPVELAILEGVRVDPGIRRSDVLALALAGAAERVKPEDWSRFLERHGVGSFVADASVTEAARRLTATPKAELEEAVGFTAEESLQAAELLAARDLRPTTGEPGVQYRTFFGFLHAHSHLSDGQGGALEAYKFAREQGRLDFFGLTDHGVNLLLRWPWEDKWATLRQAAEETYEPGAFATFWGFEWSNPLLGHVGVVNSADFTHTLARIRMPELYAWLVDRPEAFARFNHPGRRSATVLGFDLRELSHFDLYPEAVPQMVGLELWNKEDGFDRFYYSGSWNGDPRSFLDVGIQKGWQLGTLGGQDNHQKQWGTANDFRTGVLAEELTREGIIDAYRNRRIYSTEDKDLVLDFRASGFPMGSHLTGVEPRFEVTARDGSGDTFRGVRLYRNGVELENRRVAGNAISVTFTDPSPTGADYYYVIVTQSDDNDGNGRNDEAISSPIWIDAE